MSAAFIVALCLALPLPALDQQAPPRDTAVTGAATGSGVVRGTVLTRDAAHPLPQPVRRALVTLTNGTVTRNVTTDDAGAFLIDHLPASTFNLSAAKSGYLPTVFGETRRGGPGIGVVVGAGQIVTAPMTLTLGGVIGGTIRDAAGHPRAGVQVAAMVPPAPGVEWGNGGATTMSTTDDQGAYRLSGLAPDSYLIVAVSTSPVRGVIHRRSVEEVDDLFARLAARQPGQPVDVETPGKTTRAPQAAATGTIAPAFYPGVTSWRTATQVAISAGQQLAGTDFVLAAVPSASIEGVLSSPVADASAIDMSLIIDGPIFGFGIGSRPILTRDAASPEKFRYDNVVEGHYRIMARAQVTTSGDVVRPMNSGIVTMTGGGGSSGSSRPDVADSYFAAVDVDVTSGGVTNVSVQLQPGATLSGTIALDPAKPGDAPDLSNARFRLSPLTFTSMSSTDNTSIGDTFQSIPYQLRQADGSVVIRGIPPGEFNVVGALNSPTSRDWWLRSAVQNGRDLLDAPVTVRSGDALTGVVFTISNRHSELKGTLTTADGRAAAEYFVVVVPKDSRGWIPRTRRVKNTRPLSNGTFSLKDLPEGDYLLAALTDAIDDDFNDPAFLAAVAAAGVAVHVTDGQVTIQDLRIGIR
jgi:hypothetical protein